MVKYDYFVLEFVSYCLGHGAVVTKWLSASNLEWESDWNKYDFQ